MARGFVYLVAVMDWFTRRILAWRLSNTLEAAFCIDAVEEALANYGCPQIFNTDQGSQFTSADFTNVLSRNAIAISMDGKGAWRGQCLRRALLAHRKIRGSLSVRLRQRRQSIGRYLDFYNAKRPHTALDRRTPDQVYFDPLPLRTAA